MNKKTNTFKKIICYFLNLLDSYWIIILVIRDGAIMGGNAHFILKIWIIDNGLILFSIFDFPEIDSTFL